MARGVVVELLLLLEVEDLEGARLGLEGDDHPVPVHDGTVGLDGPPCDVVAILQLDNDDFWGGILALLLADTDVVIGLECLGG